MHRREHDSVMPVRDGLVEVFTLRLGSIIVILARHDLEVGQELSLLELDHLAILAIGVNRLASLPVVFVAALEELMISHAI